MDKEIVKLIAVGDQGVGKTSILNRYVNSVFDQSESATLGATFFTKKIKLNKYQPLQLQLQIWDTAGQQKYRAIAPIYYRQAKIALCIYDTCSKNSFEALKKWVDELEFSGPRDIVMAIVGNKIDRFDDQEVDNNEVQKYATQKNAIFKLVSAKENSNIIDLFETACMKLKKGITKSSLILEKNTQSKPKKKSKCC